ncbi:class I tRNA ligase family protein, partial [Staphylococcus pettenkoferi]|uniref:class I tRNA ligase family protein n=1 Tax=Staphylococcus pettenkoferi TaxID=170573 RepID=UPI0021B49023
MDLGQGWDRRLEEIIRGMKGMEGYERLYLGGMEHAGIATECKVEGKLGEEGICGDDLGGEK